MAKEYNFLKNGDKMFAGDYIVSPNRMFFGMLKGEGAFQIYRGKNPDDHIKGPIVWRTIDECKYSHDHDEKNTIFAILHDNAIFALYDEDKNGTQIKLWESPNNYQATGNYVVFISDDGNFNMYRYDGIDPKNGLGWVWTAAKTQSDHIINFEVTEITYTDKAQKLIEQKYLVASKTIPNHTQYTTHPEVLLGNKVKQSSSWTLTPLGNNVVYDPINVTFSCPVNIPIVNDEDEIVETVVTDIKTIPDKTKILRDKCEKATTHGKIKPGEKGTFVLYVQKSSVTASFTFTGTATYSRKTDKGEEITQNNATIHGYYEGCNTHNTDAHQEGDELKIAITH
jgi:hypothetical protein